MIKKIKNYQASFITTLIYSLMALSILSSCSMVQTAVRSNPSLTDPNGSESLYIEDFYHESVAQPTISPESSYNFRRQDIRTEDKSYAQAEQRSLDADLYRESLENGDIGGEDILVVAAEPDTQIGNAVTIVSETKINDFGVATISEKFDPLKLSGNLNINVLMSDMSCFSMPVCGVINSNFGWRHGRVHSGIDLDLETGDMVMAAIDGEVTTAEYNGGYGNLVVLKHANGLETYYAHLSKIQVKPGDKVLAGDVLGLGGSTGRSTGPHLHFETRYQGAAFDPALLVDFKTQQLKTEILTLDNTSFKVVNQASNNSKSGSGSKYHTVRKGDTLGKIASKNGTSVSKLCKLNKISAKKILQPGMKLRVK